MHKKKIKRSKPRRRTLARPDKKYEAIYGRPENSHSLNPIGTWRRMKLSYSQTNTFTIASGLSALQIFRANSVFDPDLTGVGGQPLEFDQMTPLFNRYRVNAYGYYIECPSVVVSYSTCSVIVNGTETPVTIDEINEYPGAKFKSVGFNGAPPGIHKGRHLLSKYNGQSFKTYNFNEFTGSQVGTNPAEIINFLFFVNNYNLTSITVNITFKMWYDVVFYDPIIPGRSLKKPLGVHLKQVEEMKEIEEEEEKSDDGKDVDSSMSTYITLVSNHTLPSSVSYQDYLKIICCSNYPLKKKI